MKKVLIPIGLFFVGKWIFTKINTAKNLQFGIVNIDVQAGFPFSKIVVKIKIVNPTTGTVTVNNINGTLSLNAKPVGTLLTTNVFEVPASGSVDVNVDVQLNNFYTIASLLNVLSNKNATFNFNGTVTAQHITFPVNYDYKFL